MSRKIVSSGRCRGALVMVALSSVVLGACGSKKEVELGSTYVKSALIVASAGGSIEVAASDHDKLAGTKITIPAGALTKDTTITIGYDPGDITTDGTAAIGPTVELGPEGTTFLTPAVVTIPYSGTFDAKRLVVYAKDSNGTTVIPAHDLVLDTATKTVRFQVEHFTYYQCGNAPAPAECDPMNDCGPAPGLPNWTCADGSLGGPTGNCLRQADGTCGWEINWCPMTCDPMIDCGPAPAIAAICNDGSIAEMVCERADDGACGWTFHCPDVNCGGTMDPNTGGFVPPPTGCGGCMTDADCPQGTICDASTAQCTPTQVQCGNSVCGDGQYCCNESCGICAGLGEACPQVECVGCGQNDPMAPGCPPGTSCDPMTGQCVEQGVPCGNSVCGEGEYCCNESCGTCAAFGTTCSQDSCSSCGDPSTGMNTCPPDHQCDASGQCVPLCPADACGPAPGLATWICEDGSVGGFTGQCIPSGTNSGGMGGRPTPTEPMCTWEIIWCPRACDPMECGPQPGLPNYVCPDGMTVAGPTGQCLRLEDGACGWEIISCP
ncbi:hypothetical protein L6R52_09585 [Myxococcota bacterium]|nr:hypothetical protein [Myxococcota bacterium]